MEKRLQEIQERISQILAALEDTNLTAEQLGEFEQEQRALEAEAAQLRSKMSLRGRLQSMDTEPDAPENDDEAQERAETLMRDGVLRLSAAEVRSAFMKRETLISTGTLVKPAKSATEINDNLNPVPSILDMVSTIDATGAGSYEEPYVKSEMTASERTDGSAGTASDPSFRVAKLSPSLINVTSYISRNIKRVSPVAYEAKVRELALKALRRKAATLIVNGNTDVYGIKTAKNTDSEAIFKTLELAKGFTADTLKTIVFSYGGNDELGGNARLFLTKQDLMELGKIRGTNEKKALFEITPDAGNPNTGTIKEGGLIVPYSIHSGLTSHADADASTQTMLYGDPVNYELALFGDYEINVYEQTKAAEGMLTIIGEVMLGGNLVVDGGFVVATTPES